MVPKKEDLIELLDKFLDGRCTPSEEEFLRTWVWELDLADDPLFRNALAENEVSERMLTAISNHIAGNAPVIIRRHSFIRMARRLAIAAVVLLVIVALYLLRSGVGDKNHPAVAAHVESGGSDIRKFFLPDSTEVTLNYYSSLEWKEDYDRKERRVLLKGEGYFRVHKDPLHPFIVETDSLETKALGTAFNVECYGNEGEVRVSLLEGSVSIARDGLPGDIAVLTPGNMLRYARVGGDAKKTAVAVEDVAAWTRGSLVFNNIPLTEALERMAKRYHLQIHYNREQMHDKHVTAVFDRMKWQDALSNMLFLNDMNYTVRDSVVTIQ